MLNGEMDVLLAGSVKREAGNRRNGTSRKTANTSSELIVLDIPRACLGRFDLVLIGKYQQSLGRLHFGLRGVQGFS